MKVQKKRYRLTNLVTWQSGHSEEEARLRAREEYPGFRDVAAEKVEPSHVNFWKILLVKPRP